MQSFASSDVQTHNHAAEEQNADTQHDAVDADDEAGATDSIVLPSLEETVTEVLRRYERHAPRLGAPWQVELSGFATSTVWSNSL